MWAGIVAFFKNAKAVITILVLIRDAAIWVAETLRLRAQKKESDGMKEAEDQLDEANQISDEQERLKKKAEAACELEKAINPDSDCR